MKLDRTRMAKMIILFGLILCLFVSANASVGDRSKTFQKCLDKCENITCRNDQNLSVFYNTRSWYHKLLYWDCTSECQYECMWYTVHTYERNGYAIPQFYGKWPFIRILGIQEPASVMFSVLNAVGHVWAFHQLRKGVFKNSLLLQVWKGQCILAVNAWFWSTVFHTRDFPVTEKMDYFCAFSLVLYSFFAFWIRNFEGYPWWILASLPIPFVAYFTYHVYYLSWIHFDYKYNMQANITVGLLNSVSWLAWCVKNRQRKYVWKCALCVLLVNVVLLLELADFPPIWYVFDAHSLWHLGTVPLPLLWYSFVKDDMLYPRKIVSSKEL